VIETGKISKDL
jgi:hypothetical protein